MCDLKYIFKERRQCSSFSCDKITFPPLLIAHDSPRSLSDAAESSVSCDIAIADLEPKTASAVAASDSAEA